VEANFRAVFASARRAGSGLGIVPTSVNTQKLGDVAIVTFEFERGSGFFG
jgi:hypothetical protein